jgi:site-specific DNA-methyltransferase (adenine-specific)
MESINNFKNKIICGDCLEIMKNIPDKSVDMILCDLPYGTTRNKWDVVIPLEPLWKEYERIIKDNGAIVLTAVQIFASQLVMSKTNLFKYDLIWKKTIASGQLNVNNQPLRLHEHILVFYKKQPTYNQQFTKGEPYTINRKANYKGETYNKQTETFKENEGFRHPVSVLEFPNPRIKNGHPTQKPVELFKWLIKAYTNKGDIVLDNCIGSGTTAVACLETNRDYIGIELNKKYCDMSKKRIKETIESYK